MKIKLTLLVAVVLGISTSCTNPVKEEKTESPTADTTLPAPQSEHQHSESEAIELNNGAKWTVVPDMMKYIRTMESDIKQFAESKKSDLKDFQQLGTALQKNVDLLTSNCTMEGKAHDELHKWLVPYIDLVSKLNKSENADEAKKVVEEIQTSYQTFNIYFE